MLKTFSPSRIAFVMMTSLFVFGAETKAADDAAKLPLIYAEDFEKGAKKWKPTDATAWKIKKTDSGNVYSQFKKQSNYKPPHRSPYNISLLKDTVVGDFVLTARVLSTHEDYAHRDVCLFFGYQDPGHFYYVHLGKKADDHANQIFIVDGKARTKISTKSTSGTNWDDKWHNVKIVRKISGKIEIYFDDMKNPVMTADNDRFKSGRIGLGSFDDTGDWDDVKLRGVVAKKSK